MDAKKLFHAIVVMGMTAACSSGTTEPPQDAATGADSSKDSSGGQDVAQADTGGGTDAGSDGLPGWLGC